MTTACKNKALPNAHPSEELSSVTFKIGANVLRQLRELAQGRELTEHDIARELVVASLAGPSITDLLAYLRSREEAAHSQNHHYYEQLKEIRQGLFCAFSYFLSNAGNLSIDEAIQWAQANMFPKSGTNEPEVTPATTTPSDSILPATHPNPLSEFIEPSVPECSDGHSAIVEQSTLESPTGKSIEQTGSEPDYVDSLVQAMRFAFEVGKPFEEVLAKARAKFDASLN